MPTRQPDSAAIVVTSSHSMIQAQLRAQSSFALTSNCRAVSGRRTRSRVMWCVGLLPVLSFLFPTGFLLYRATIRTSVTNVPCLKNTLGARRISEEKRSRFGMNILGIRILSQHGIISMASQLASDYFQMTRRRDSPLVDGDPRHYRSGIMEAGDILY